MSVIIFFIILIVLVLAHEFGHFSAAKGFGIRVDEFGFGFPPKLFGKKFKGGETEYSVNLLPFGGFVKIYGENPDEENTSGPDGARSMVNKPKWKQAIVLFAGVFANFALAWLLFSICLMSGLPASAGSAPDGYKLSDSSLVVMSVLPGSPAEKAGLAQGDKILSLKSDLPYGRTDVLSEVSPEGLKAFIISHKDDQIKIGYTNEGVLKEVTVTPAPDIVGGNPGIGISMDEIGVIKLPFFPALWAGLRLDWSTASATAVGLYNLIANSIAGHSNFSSVAGPVGLVNIVGEAYRFGFVYLLSFTALISVNLAIINLAPFPALDGGRLLFLLVEKIKGSRLNPKFANAANMIGFALIIILMLVVTYHDIVRLM